MSNMGLLLIALLKRSMGRFPAKKFALDQQRAQRLAGFPPTDELPLKTYVFETAVRGKL
jgi:hypothetical protein